MERIIKILQITLLCLFILSPALADVDKIGFTIETDGSLPEHLSAPWLGYLMGRQVYIMEHKNEYELSPGIIVPKFEDEVEGRQTLAQIWKELKEKDNNLKDKYLNELEVVLDAGFMREYVWVYLRYELWKKPDKLRLKEFANWKKQNLKNHKAVSYGNIRVTVKTAE
ncbi:MAG: hypothetical protein A2X59_12380 [Nitrospirae bacterium GWC2_42_7]|nr:MAG: hypothetical protein A2X59_12380 [Nitrospirae bacterium GWC2_42_7]